jgi:hypothetical protein
MTRCLPNSGTTKKNDSHIRTIFFFVSLRAPCDVATRRAGLE